MKYSVWFFLFSALVLTPAGWCGCPDGMKPIPSGNFMMGFRDSETNTGSFCMDIYEVTVADYQSFKPDFVPHELSEPADHPVTFITQIEAAAYCKSLGKRLPSEEEWEKACRGPKGWKYPYGDEFDGSLCHTSKVARVGTVKVGSYPKCVSGYGIFDMAGNAMEWTMSDHSKAKNFKVIKSSAWPHSTTTSRCSNRFKNLPQEKFSNTGFRCVK